MEKIDNLDRKILGILSKNARIPFKDVAAECGVSRAAIHQRVQHLMEDGFITGSGFDVNPKSLGYSTCTYVGLNLERGNMYKKVVERLQNIPEIVECHFTTGSYTMLLKLYARDNEQLMDLLNNKLQAIPGVVSTETLISLEQSIKREVPVLLEGNKQMETFDLESHLKGAYSSFPEAKHQPVIGLTANYENIDATLRDRYYKQVIAAGGTPVIIPPVADSTVIINTLEHLDGLILTGGGDHNPLWMGEEPSPRLHNINQERDAAELMLVRLAFNRQIPMLGICRGIQTLAIALGGKVYQDIKQMVKHSQDADRSEPTHSVEIKKDSTLYQIYNSEKILVNSFHHQAVSEPGRRSASSPNLPMASSRR